MRNNWNCGWENLMEPSDCSVSEKNWLICSWDSDLKLRKTDFICDCSEAEKSLMLCSCSLTWSWEKLTYLWLRLWHDAGCSVTLKDWNVAKKSDELWLRKSCESCGSESLNDLWHVAKSGESVTVLRLRLWRVAEINCVCDSERLTCGKESLWNCDSWNLMSCSCENWRCCDL